MFFAFILFDFFVDEGFSSLIFEFFVYTVNVVNFVEEAWCGVYCLINIEEVLSL